MLVPQPLVDIYEWQENVLRIRRSPISRSFTRAETVLEFAGGRSFSSTSADALPRFRALRSGWWTGTRSLSLKTGDVDFTMGGHAYRYLYIPVYEIWIDDAIAKKRAIFGRPSARVR